MTIKVDKNIYSKEVLLKTAYSFTERAYLHLAQDEDNWIISWTDKPDSQISGMEFENELIAQQLREELLQKTADIRKLVLARAFASTIIDESSNDKSETGQAELSADEERNILKGWFDHGD